MKKFLLIGLLMASFAIGALSTRSIHTTAQAQSAVAAKEPRSALEAKKGVRCQVIYKLADQIRDKWGLFNSATDKWVVLDDVEEYEPIMNANGQSQSEVNGQPAYRTIKKQYWIAAESVTTMAFTTKQ